MNNDHLSNFKWSLKSFDELLPNELYDLIHLRLEVFAIEQDCIYQDLDYVDQKAYHLMAYDNSKLAAYVRIIPPQIQYKNGSSIGRVVTSKNTRDIGLGKLLMKKAIKETKQLFPESDIIISAQCYLDQFYKNLGFKVVGKKYLEDGIDHQKMILS